MNFWTNGDELSFGFDLEDDDPEDLDLTAEGLGQSILEYAVRQMATNCTGGRAPDGSEWAPLRPRTIQAKGHAVPGFETGAMLADLDNGVFQVGRRSASWSYPHGETWPRAHAFHNGRVGTDPRRPDLQAARKFIGWTDHARSAAELLTQIALLPTELV